MPRKLRHYSGRDISCLLLLTFYAVLGVKVEHDRSYTESNASDIVAQFVLPYAPSDGTAGTTTTSTESNFANQTGVPSSVGAAGSSSVQSKNYFTHLTFDVNHNVFYAGATNKILKLNENLRVLAEAVTGPKHDAAQCHAGGCPEDIETTLVNNFNKILVVSYTHNDGSLISCGSIRQGMLLKYKNRSYNLVY